MNTELLDDLSYTYQILNYFMNTHYTEMMLWEEANYIAPPMQYAFENNNK